MSGHGEAQAAEAAIDGPASMQTAVLIVDDDPDISQALMDLLEHEGYQVDTAGTGAEALERSAYQRYSAVILDLGLPDVDGLVVLQGLLERHPKLPIIILTAFTSEERTVGAISQGAFAFLTKPYNRDQLRATLQRAIGISVLATKAEHIQHALTESEERFRSVVQSASDAIILADHRGRIISWNKAATRMFLYTEEEVLGRSLTIIMPIRYRAAHQAGLERLRTTGQGRVVGNVIELHGLKKDGKEFPIELSLATWKSTSGMYVSGIIRDIAERKHIESALRASEERYRLALTAGRLGTWDWNIETKAVAWSDTMEGFFGMAPGTFGGTYQAFLQCVHPDDRETLVRALRAAVEEQADYDIEHRVVWPDGTDHWLACRGRVLHDETGKAVRMLGTAQCISRRKEAEQSLERLRRQQQSILEAAGEGIYGLDAEGCTTFVNPAAVRMLQWTGEELIGRPMHAILHYARADGSPYPAEDCPIYAALHGGPLQRAEDEVFWRRDGSCFPVEYVSTPIRQDGAVRGAVVVFKDITDRKRTEAALRRSEDFKNQILSSSPDWITVLDLSGHVEFMNQAGLRIMKIADPAPLLKTAWAEFWRGQDRDAALTALHTALGGGVGQFTGFCPTMVGESKWWDVLVTSMHDADGHPERLLAISRDMTERKRMEDALRESEERFRQVTENIREVFWMTDLAKNQMLYISPAYEEIWGRSCDGLYHSPMSWMDAIHPDDRDRVRQAAQLKQNTGDYAEEYRIIRPDGSIRWIRDRAFPVRNASGVVYRIAGLAEDITELKASPEPSPRP